MKTEWFEVRASNDSHCLGYNYQTPEQALEEINASYLKAKEQGYDNRDNQWMIVFVQLEKKVDENGQFLAEDRKRTLHCKVKFDGERFVKRE